MRFALQVLQLAMFECLQFETRPIYEQYDIVVSRVLRTHITVPKKMATKEALRTTEVSMPIVLSIVSSQTTTDNRYSKRQKY